MYPLLQANIWTLPLLDCSPLVLPVVAQNHRPPADEDYPVHTYLHISTLYLLVCTSQHLLIIGNHHIMTLC